MVLSKNQGFLRKFFVKVIFLYLTLDFIIKSVLNIRNRFKLGVEQNRGHFGTGVVWGSQILGCGKI